MVSPQTIPITRNRERLSCMECRRRKLRCDRISPCTRCIHRGAPESCVYQRFVSRSEEDQDLRGRAQERLDHLEQLVQQLVQQPDSHQSASASSTAVQDANSESQAVGAGVGIGIGTGQSSGSGQEASAPTYHGSTHWSAMLDDIQELKDTMSFTDTSHSPFDDAISMERAGVGLIFGSPASITLDEILTRYLPSQQESDRLTSAYFRTRSVAAPFIHSSQFSRLYKAFWAEPRRAPPLWTSILFSIFHIATNALQRNLSTDALDERFLVASAHCLAVGDYFRPKRFALEALVLFVQSQCLTSLNLTRDVGMTFALVIRLATSMGYHKDPSRLGLSPFEEEMRRRLWSFCMQLDLLVSFHLGLPSGVQYPTWDTPLPRNLLDSDFDESSVELPPERHDSEPTGILFYISKHKFSIVFEKILRHTLSTKYDAADTATVDALDAEIAAVYNSLPESLRPRSMCASIADPGTVIATRLCVSLVYNKCLCVLHRPYITQHRQASVLGCYRAARSLVSDVVAMYREFLPGGQAEAHRWLMSSIGWHDFLLGIMCLCLVLCANDHGGDASTGADVDVAETVALLENAQEACTQEYARMSRETRRIQLLIQATLRRVGRGNMAMDGNSLLGTGLNAGVGAEMQGLQVSPDDVWAWNEPSLGPMDDTFWSFLGQHVDLAGDLSSEMS